MGDEEEEEEEEEEKKKKDEDEGEESRLKDHIGHAASVDCSRYLKLVFVLERERGERERERERETQRETDRQTDREVHANIAQKSGGTIFFVYLVFFFRENDAAAHKF